MNINIFNILIITGVIHGFIFSFVILFGRKYRTKSSPYLALVALFLSLHNLYYWVLDFGFSQSIPYYDNIYVPWNLLILPMYYFFVQDYLQVEKKNRISYLAPFIFSFLIHLCLLINSIYHQNFDTKYTTFEIIFYYTEEYLSLVFTVFVIIKTFQFIRKKEKEAKLSQQKILIQTNWLKKLLYQGIFICFIWLCLTRYSQINSTGQFNTNFRYILWLSISFLIYWLGYSGVYHGLVLKQRVFLSENRKSNTKDIIVDNNPKIEKVREIIEKEKLFLDASPNIQKISNMINMSDAYFSTMFNQNSSDSFSTYLNKLRISEAKSLLLKKEYQHYTIVSIGLESGFNSKSAFYRVFKEHTGLTPLEFRRKNMS